MGFRRLISLVAMFGVLLHAGLIVRHSSIMLNANLLHNDLVTALGVICHSGGGTKQLPASDLPSIPAPSENQDECPICTGMMAGAAILPAMSAIVQAPYRASARIVVVGEAVAQRLVRAWPAPRGPPAAA